MVVEHSLHSCATGWLDPRPTEPGIVTRPPCVNGIARKMNYRLNLPINMAKEIVTGVGRTEDHDYPLLART